MKTNIAATFPHRALGRMNGASKQFMTFREEPGTFATVALPFVATCGYNGVMEPIGIRELKNNLSHYVRKVEAGHRISVTANGRVVAELLPPGSHATAHRKKPLSRYEQLVAEGLIRPALEVGDPFEDDGLQIKLKSGTVQDLIDWTREDKWESNGDTDKR